MPKMITHIDSMTIHPGEAGIGAVSVWFTEHRTQHEGVTVAPIDLFDYRLFAARVLELTGHPFVCLEVEAAPDAWHAETRWRALVRAQLEEAGVEPNARFHWKPLIS